MSAGFTSRYLGRLQIAALARAGDVLIPPSSDAPSFRASGCAHRVDALLEYVAEGDRRALGLLLTLLYFCPPSVHRWLLRRAAASFERAGLLAPVFRQIDYGLRGLLLTLYFAEATRG